MEFFLNELSLHAQFENIDLFYRSLEKMLSNRKLISEHGYRFFCNRDIINYLIDGRVSFQKAVEMSQNVNLKRKIKIWLSKDGPFWDDLEERAHSPNDLFEYNGEIVTDTSLGEAALRKSRGGHLANMISFQPSSFETTPLLVLWHKETQQISIEISNYWDSSILRDLKGNNLPNFSLFRVLGMRFLIIIIILIHQNTRGITIKSKITIKKHPGALSQTELMLGSLFLGNSLSTALKRLESHLKSWNDMLSRAKSKFNHLILLDYLIEYLNPEPFSETLANKVMDRLHILDKLAGCYDEHGARTAEGHELFKNYFHGDNSIFKDESDSNLRKFKNDLTFRLPNGEFELCGYHGKITLRQFRIHFNGPVRYGQPVYIVYIGYKITRD